MAALAVVLVWFVVDFALDVWTSERAYNRLINKAPSLVNAAWAKRIA